MKWRHYQVKPSQHCNLFILFYFSIIKFPDFSDWNLILYFSLISLICGNPDSQVQAYKAALHILTSLQKKAPPLHCPTNHSTAFDEKEKLFNYFRYGAGDSFKGCLQKLGIEPWTSRSRASALSLSYYHQKALLCNYGLNLTTPLPMVGDYMFPTSDSPSLNSQTIVLLRLQTPFHFSYIPPLPLGQNIL